MVVFLFTAVTKPGGQLKPQSLAKPLPECQISKGAFGLTGCVNASVCKPIRQAHTQTEIEDIEIV